MAAFVGRALVAGDAFPLGEALLLDSGVLSFPVVQDSSRIFKAIEK
jgi:hypothetical protein